MLSTVLHRYTGKALQLQGIDKSTWGKKNQDIFREADGRPMMAS